MAKLDWSIKGRYLKNCNCIAACPCDTVGVPYPGKGCEGMAGMHIEEGHFDNVKLDGLSWVVTYMWPGPLHEGNGSVQAFVDQRATQEQRDALLQILSGRAGNVWFEFLVSTVTKIYPPQFVRIEFEFELKKRKARVLIPGALETVSAPLMIPNTGQQRQVIVQIPEGIEYKEMEVAQAMVLKGSAAIKFDHQNTHSSMAHVEQTHEGLKA